MPDPARPASRASSPDDETMRFERLVSGISARFIAAPIGRMEEVIVDALADRQTLGVDRSTLSSVDPRTGAFHSTHSWAAPASRRCRARCRRAPTRGRSRVSAAGLPVVFSRVADLPLEAADDAASYAGIGLGAHVGVPVLVSGEFLAVLGVAAMREERAWTDEFVVRMRLLAELFGSALARHAAEERARQATAHAAHAREQLAHLARVDAVGAMSAAIAHEINQPLMAIEN
jgi:GAF domain-containing protein